MSMKGQYLSTSRSVPSSNKERKQSLFLLSCVYINKGLWKSLALEIFLPGTLEHYHLGAELMIYLLIICEWGEFCKGSKSDFQMDMNTDACKGCGELRPIAVLRDTHKFGSVSQLV